MKMAKWILTLQWQDDLWDVSKQEEMRTKKILRDKQSMKTWIDTQRYERIWRYNSTTGSLCNPKVGRISFCFSPLSLLPSLRLVSKFCGFFYITLVSVFFFWLSINMQWEHWRPARCHRCYWLAYYTEKRAAVIKCHWPQKMYHPPSPSFLPFSLPIPIHLLYIFIVFDFWFQFYCHILFDHE